MNLLKSALLIIFVMSASALAQDTPEPEADIAVSQSDSLESLVENLNAASFNAKAKAIDELTRVKDPRVLPILKLMVNGDLYYRKSDDRIVSTRKVEDGTELTDILNGEVLGVVGSRDAGKVRINNSLRGQLRTAIAVLELTADDKKTRIESARNLIRSPDENLRDELIAALEAEQSGPVAELLRVAVARIDIDQPNQSLRLAAVEQLGATVEPEAVAVLRRLADKDANGEYVEENKEVAKAADKALELVDTKLGFYQFSENLLFGLSAGSVLLLAAIGLAITFGVMGVINMAHGEMIMLGAYTTFAIQQLFPNYIGASLFIAIPAAFIVSGSAGVLIERLVIRHLYGRPLDTLLATFGISLILQQAVRMYRSNNVPVITPEWMSGSWQINGALSVTFNRIYILIFSLFVLAMLALLLKKTLVGLQMRAVTQNRAMANSMGIKSNWVDALTFGLGSGVAGIAGVALSQITNVGPNLGQAYIIDSFMVVVFGGVGNLLGTFFGAMSLGVANKFLEPYVGAVLGKIIILVFIILFIQWRPRGLFALKGRFVED